MRGRGVARRGPPAGCEGCRAAGRRKGWAMGHLHQWARPVRGAGRQNGGRDGRRRGMTSVLAMLYLMLFSALALGFYAQATTASQLSNNERNSHQAMIGA